MPKSLSSLCIAPCVREKFLKGKKSVNRTATLARSFTSYYLTYRLVYLLCELKLCVPIVWLRQNHKSRDKNIEIIYSLVVLSSSCTLQTYPWVNWTFFVNPSYYCSITPLDYLVVSYDNYNISYLLSFIDITFSWNKTNKDTLKYSLVKCYNGILCACKILYLSIRNSNKYSPRLEFYPICMSLH